MSERAALAERMARAIQSAVRKEVTMNVLRQDMLAAEAALAAVEAAGGWPPMETTELKPFVGRIDDQEATPEPDAEVRDVLAGMFDDWSRSWAIEDNDDWTHDAADESLAALRANGFAVVRTADVEAVTRYLDSQRDIWDERASRACDALEEAIR